MEQQKIIDEINYHKAQKITELLYKNGLISFVEYDKLILSIGLDTIKKIY